METKNHDRRNAWTFGLGTVGRDMLYTLVSMFLMVYMSEVIDVSDATLAIIGGFLMGARVFDAVNDPIMGTIVDNTKTRWGKFKPWIAIGAVLSGVLTLLMFYNFRLSGASFIALFIVIYMLWEIAFTMNDIGYWSMLPSLSISQRAREKTGAVARICANIGLFSVVAAIIPLTNALGELTGDLSMGWFVFAAGVVVILLLGQMITLFGVKEPKGLFTGKAERTTLKDMFKAIAKNDQLIVVALSMVLFMIGYTTTTSFGVYYFKYYFKNEDLYSIFAIVLGVSQIAALVGYPFIAKRISRKLHYIIATALVVAGYLIFFFSPPNIVPVIIAGILLFVGQAFIQLLMLVFLTDTVEYGQWKNGKRNESVTFAIQPFINKMGSAIATGVLTVTLIISGINTAPNADAVTDGGLWIMRIAMMLLPLLSIVAGFILYFFKFKIDKKLFDQIITDLKDRGEISNKEQD